MDKMSKHALWGLIFNAAYSAYHILFGVSARSWWLFTLGIYYLILCAVRFSVLRTKERWRLTVGFTGVMLMVLSLPLVGTVILSFLKDRGTVFPLVVMLAIAVYAFTKITLATIHWIKARKGASAKRITLRNISFADAFVSIFSLQRSMLVSFEGMTAAEIQMMNAMTGSAVCIIVFLLGLNLLRHREASEQK